MIRVELPELGRRTVRLTPEQGRRLATSGVVSAAPSAYEVDAWDVAALRRVGVARVGDVEVWIQPKLAVDRLLFLVGYARDPLGWREETTWLDPRPGLVPAVAQALRRQVERALARGLLQGYRMVEESSPVLRGRLREADQLRRRFGLAIPMEIRHDDFTVDVAENQILLAAITRLLGVPGVDEESRRHLAALRVRLAGVTPPTRGAQLPGWQPSRLNDRYRNALRLAEIVWRATAPDHSPGTVAATGFLFELWSVFEDFVTAALTEHLGRRHLGAGVPQYPCYLDEASAVPMRPDLVWERAGRPVAVVDAKYKSDRPGQDLYQVLAYCSALGLRQGHLVYAAGDAPARHVVRRAGIEIHTHALDLTLPSAAVLAQVGLIGDQVLAAESLTTGGR